MTSKITPFIFAFFLTGFCFAQSPNSQVRGGEFVFSSKNKPCITPEQRNDMIHNIKTNIKKLRQENKLSFSKQRRGSHPLFIWPIQKASNVSYNEVYSVFNYVDHDTGFPNQVEDYTCGTRTYDTTGGYNHKGTDIVTWPFRWKMMDDDGVEIIAAAPGQIIFIRDGEFDRHCSASTATDPWNIVVIQHSDGSVALYGHMKNGSTTTKMVGDMVTEGEYLGIVGSSGSSDFPHLHFEVYEDEVEGVPTGLIDPYSGSCNNMNPDSWWQSQRPYNDPGINAALTHSASPIFPTCPQAEITNEKDAFATGETVYFAVYLKDQIENTSLNLKILRPDGSVYSTWDFDLTANYYASYWNWPYSIPSIPGNWTWRVTYQGEVVDHFFTMGTLSLEEESFNQTSVFPNPFNDIINISSTTKIAKANLIDVLGKTVLSLKSSSEGITTIDLSSLSNGMYFLMLESNDNEKKTIKLIKE